ncbi:unnamed protein product [Strongylus vulgaris]|uniref:Uncharacterized protein n=1 Tax=Strongylus vulgaris TaxID=40348 RepID=A0A3P7L1Q6_STRVU|nr:unnamed protein product [Strongylus vulgaris]
MVRNMSSRRRTKGKGEESQIDYARMEEERNNSSEMKPQKQPTDNDEENSPKQAEAGTDASKITDRPEV